ncbi:class I SAM-dependent methyltransferase [Gilvibacter sediminis]|uniref:class I SAM-dependent methyltransferase n=1 Tax=Gilvibacter sediminis TaxID=379071 RepID=UPI0023506B19|nr:class I SAM-dependent methyltransferase [Gilvibacter sediminis]MDC7997804.1 class I SAM-dependent methyltransferase [Gilvibacter sediminis]
MQEIPESWYTSWFNSPYYHILYKDRDYSEAAGFMDNLTRALNLPKSAHILDLACGRGRHSIYLAGLGYRVTGADLSPKSIAEAKKHERPGLQFVIHDMCLPFLESFDAIFNLFTSFGYFESANDNLRAIRAIKQSLAPDGVGVIDFLNVNHVAEHLVANEEKTVDGIAFKITRQIDDKFITKTISFEDQGKEHVFAERVSAMDLDQFKAYFEIAGVTLINTYGDYELAPFDPDTSERLILIFK